MSADHPTKVEITAAAILATLDMYDPNPVPTDMLKIGIEAHGGDPAYLQTAARWLRDGGTMVVATKARHLSTWVVASEDSEVRTWDKRVRREHLAETISMIRALSGCSIPEVQRRHNQIMATAVQMGADMDIPAAAILEMCLPVRQGVSA